MDFSWIDFIAGFLTGGVGLKVVQKINSSRKQSVKGDYNQQTVLETKVIDNSNSKNRAAPFINLDLSWNKRISYTAAKAEMSGSTYTTEEE